MESIYKSLVKKYQIYLKLLIISFTIASGSFFSSVFFILTLVQWFIGAILNIQMDACWVIALPWMYRFCALWILLSLVLISVYYSTYGVRKRINFQEISFYAPRLLKLVFWAIITGFLISYVIISVLHFPKEATLLSSLFNEEKKLIDWMLFVSIEGCILTVSIFLLFCKNIVRNSDITPFGTNKKQNKLFELGLEYSAYYKFWANALFTAGIMTVAFYSILWPFFGDFILSVLVNEFPNWLQRIMSRSEWQSLDTVQKQIGFIGANIIILLGNLGILILLPMYFFTKISFLMHVKMQLRDRKYQIVGLVNKNSTDLALIVGIVSVITSSMLHSRLEPFFYEGFLKDLYNMIYIYFVSPTIFALALKSRIFGYVMVERYSKKIHNPNWIGYIVLLLLFSLYHFSSAKQEVVFPSDVLYHGSVNRDIIALEPNALHVRNANEGPVVFATPSLALASCYTFRWDDSWVHQTVDNGKVTMVIGDKERFESQNAGGAIYLVSKDCFSFDRDRGLGIYEWVSKEKVNTSLELDFASSFQVMKRFGVKIYFLSPEEFSSYLKLSERERERYLQQVQTND